MILYHNQELSVRRLVAPDAELLVKWLSDPLLLEYYEGRDRPHTMEMVLEHFYEEEAGESRGGLSAINRRMLDTYSSILLMLKRKRSTGIRILKAEFTAWTSLSAKLHSGIKELVRSSWGDS